MAATITDNTPGPIVVQSGSTVNPFTDVNINDIVVLSNTPPNITGGGNGNIRVTLTTLPDSMGNRPGTGLGTLAGSTTLEPGTEPTVTGTYNPYIGTFTEQTSGGLLIPDSLGPTAALHNIQYTAPNLGSSPMEVVYAQIRYAPDFAAEVSDPKPVEIDVVPAAPNGTSATTLAPPTPA